jgi:hypothetical protein
LASIRGVEERPVVVNISDVEELPDVGNPEGTILMICEKQSLLEIIQ